MIEDRPQDFYQFVDKMVKKKDIDTGATPVGKLLSLNTATKSYEHEPAKGFEFTKRDVDMQNIYTRLNSGNFIPKYDSYVTGINEEERLAALQSTGEKWGRGFTKFWSKTGMNALDATLGTANGIYEMLRQGRFSAFYDNDFAKSLDDLRTRLDNNYANYYSQEEKSMNFFEKLTTANFWANDFGDAMAFLAGAALPEVAIGIASGGSSLSLSGAKLAARGLAKETAEQALKKNIVSRTINKVDDTIGFSKGRNVLREQHRAIWGSKAGGAVSSALFLARTSGFEAGMEARHNLKESVENYTSYFEQQNGRLPNTEELAEFTDKAIRQANGVFVANMAILGISNAAMYGQLFGHSLPKLKQNNIFNRAIGLGFDVEKGIAKTQKAQRLLGNTYQILRRPVSEGLFEEGLQGVAGKTMQGYLESTYDPKKMHTDSVMASLAEAMTEQYGTAEGWNEIGVGMLVGAIGGGLIHKPVGLFTGQKGGSWVAGFGSDSYAAQRKNLETRLEKANKATEDLRTGLQKKNWFRTISRSNAAYEATQTTLDETAELKKNFNYILAQQDIMPYRDIMANYEAVVNSTELTEDQQRQLEKQGITEQDYKANLIEDFKANVAKVQKAEQIVDAFNIQDVETTEGNRIALRDAMMWNIVAGQDAETQAMSIAKEIEKVVGKDGLADALKFYQGLEEQDKKLFDELKEKQGAMAAAKQAVIDIQNKIQKLKATPEQKENINKASVEYTVAAQTVTRLSGEIEQIKKVLQDKEKTQNLNLGFLSDTQSSYTTMDLVEQLDSLDDYVSALNSVGKSKEANDLGKLLQSFAVSSQLSREYINAHRRMTAGDYFRGDKGRGMLDRILGDRYTMPNDLKEALDTNDQRIEASLEKLGISLRTKEGQTIGDAIKEAMETSEELSDREKFRLESAIRLTLNMQAYENMVSDFREFSDNVTEAENQPVPATDGDTVALRRKVSQPPTEATALQAIQHAIKQITDQIDFLRGTARSQEEIQELEQRLAELKQSLPQDTPQPTTDLSEQEYQDFVDNGVVTTQRIESIARKVMNNEQLSPRELEMFTDKTAEVNAKILELSNTTTNEDYTQTDIDTPQTEEIISESIQTEELQRQLDEATAKLEELREQQKNRTDGIKKEIERTEEDILSIEKDISNINAQIEKVEQELKNLQDEQEDDNNTAIAKSLEDKAKDAEDTRDTNLAEEILSEAEGAIDSLLNTSEEQLDFTQKYGFSAITLAEDYNNSGKIADILVSLENVSGKTVSNLTEIDEQFGVPYQEFLSDFLNSLEGMKLNKPLNVSDTVENVVIRIQPINRKATIKKTTDSLKNVVSKDTLRPTMTGIYYVGQNAVATDSHVLVVLNNNQTEQQIIDQTVENFYLFNKKTNPSFTKEQAREEVYGNLKEGSIQGLIINPKTGEVIEGRYPNYEAIIPTENNNVKENVDAQELLAETRGAKNSSKNTDNSVFEITFGDTPISFNAEKFNLAVETMVLNGAKKFIVEYSTSSRAIVIKADNGDMSLVMPLLPKAGRAIYRSTALGKTTPKANTVTYKKKINKNKKQLKEVLNQKQSLEEDRDSKQQELDNSKNNLENLKQDYTQTSETTKKGNTLSNAIQDQIDVLEKQIDDLKTQIEKATTKRQEQPTQQEQPQTKEQQVEDSDIPSVQTEIDRLERELEIARNNIKIVETEEFQRFSELQNKAQRAELTEEEIDEMDLLSTEIDRWIFATGAIVEGARLSDMIEQEAVLRSTIVTTPESIQIVTEQKILEAVDIPDSKKNPNTKLGIVDDGVIFTTKTITKKGEAIEYVRITGMSIEGLREKLVDEEETVLPYDLENTEDGAVIIPLSVVEKINANPNSKLKFPFDYNNYGRNYGQVTEMVPDMDGTMRGRPLKSDYDVVEGGVSNSVNIDAIYNASAGQPTTVKIYTEDPYNKEKLDNYRKAKEVLEEAKSKEGVPDYYASQIKEVQGKIDKLNAKKKKTKKDEEQLRENKKELAGLKKSAEIETKDAIQKRVKDATRKLEEIKDDLRRNLRMVVVDENENNISTLKGSTEYTHTNEADRMFQVFRATVVDNLLEQDYIPAVVEISDKELIIEKVYTGFPNFNRRQNADGALFTEHVPFTDETAGKVLDIGFIDYTKKSEDKRISTRNKETGIDTTFLKPFEKSKKKIPFVVLQRGNKKIAYPVRIAEQQRPSLDPFREIFESDMDPSEKAKQLNMMAAQLGLDIRDSGNAFYVGLGGVGNLNQEHFNNILGKLEKIDYFYPLKNWTSTDVSMEEILKNQVLINIDVNEPFHSPKIAFKMSDYIGSMPKVKEAYEAKKEEAVNSAKEAATSTEVEAMMNIGKEADENLNEDCPL